MKIHPKEIVEKIKQLRMSGSSIQQIMSLMSLPKTTVWHHIKDLKLTEAQKITIRSKQGGSKIRQRKALEEAEKKAVNFLISNDRENVIVIAMLYWAEGHKKNGCEFTNTDRKMIEVYLKILRKVFKIKNSDLQATVRIFTGMNKKKCLSYWASVTNIPLENIKLRLNDGGSSGKTEYGICRIRIIKGHMMLKLMHALIGKISKDVLN